jgi:hypothetical protein
MTDHSLLQRIPILNPKNKGSEMKKMNLKVLIESYGSISALYPSFILLLIFICSYRYVNLRRQVSKEIESKSITITDSKGRKRIELGTRDDGSPYIHFLGKNSNSNGAGFSFSDKGVLEFSLEDSKNHPRNIAYVDNDGSMYINIYNDNDAMHPTMGSDSSRLSIGRNFALTLSNIHKKIVLYNIKSLNGIYFRISDENDEDRSFYHMFSINGNLIIEPVSEKESETLKLD